MPYYKKSVIKLMFSLLDLLIKRNRILCVFVCVYIWEHPIYIKELIVGLVNQKCEMQSNRLETQVEMGQCLAEFLLLYENSVLTLKGCQLIA